MGSIRVLIAAAMLLLGGLRFGAAAEDLGFRPLTMDGDQVRWLAPVNGGAPVLHYAIADRLIERTGSVNCRAIRSPAQLLQTSALRREDLRRAIKTAAERWAAVTNILFAETADSASADIVIGEQVDAIGFAFTNLTLGAHKRGLPRQIRGSTICLNPLRAWKIGFDGNLAVYDLVHTLTHELGHAIGLDHPSPRGHLMSFRYSEAMMGLSPGDVRGAQFLYGSPVTAVQAANGGVIHSRSAGQASLPASLPTIGRDVVGRGMQ